MFNDFHAFMLGMVIIVGMYLLFVYKTLKNANY